jgi:hypothetical protein
MARSWNDVKADKADRDSSAGRDMAQAREDARHRTHAYILDHRRGLTSGTPKGGLRRGDRPSAR